MINSQRDTEVMLYITMVSMNRNLKAHGALWAGPEFSQLKGRSVKRSIIWLLGSCSNQHIDWLNCDQVTEKLIRNDPHVLTLTCQSNLCCGAN